MCQHSDLKVIFFIELPILVLDFRYVNILLTEILYLLCVFDAIKSQRLFYKLVANTQCYIRRFVHSYRFFVRNKITGGQSCNAITAVTYGLYLTNTTRLYLFVFFTECGFNIHWQERLAGTKFLII